MKKVSLLDGLNLAFKKFFFTGITQFLPSILSFLEQSYMITSKFGTPETINNFVPSKEISKSNISNGIMPYISFYH